MPARSMIRIRATAGMVATSSSCYLYCCFIVPARQRRYQFLLFLVRLTPASGAFVGIVAVLPAIVCTLHHLYVVPYVCPRLHACHCPLLVCLLAWSACSPSSQLHNIPYTSMVH